MKLAELKNSDGTGIDILATGVKEATELTPAHWFARIAITGALPGFRPETDLYIKVISGALVVLTDSPNAEDSVKTAIEGQTISVPRGTTVHAFGMGDGGRNEAHVITNFIPCQPEQE